MTSVQPVVDYGGITVVRYSGVQLQCPGITSLDPKHKFAATFDEVQRYVACPTCGATTEIPVEYRGMP